MRQYEAPDERDLPAGSGERFVVRPGERLRVETVVSSVDSDKQSDQDDADDGTEQIRVEIEETRQELSSTVDAIQERLNPSVLADQAREAVHDATIGKVEQMMSSATDAASDARASFMQTIRENPIPATLAGLSLGWLFYKMRSGPSGYPGGQVPYSARSGSHSWQGNAAGGAMGSTMYRPASESSGGIGDRASRMVGGAQERAGEMVDSLQGKASDVADTVHETAGQVADRASELASTAQERAERLGGRVGDLLEENPLAAGALAVAVGAAIGLSVPATRQEHQMFGKTRDNLMRQAKATTREMTHKVAQVASEAQDAAMESAREHKLTS